MKNLEKSGLKNVYRLTGDDAIQIEKALDIICSKAGVSMPEINQTIFTDETFDAEKIVLSCQQMPFLSDKRLVIVKNMAKVKDADIKKLEDYCKTPAPETILVFQEIVGLNVFSKLSAEKVICKKLEKPALVEIVNAAFSGTSKKITPAAAALLVDFCNNDQLLIQNELSKLLFAAQNEIDEDVVKKLVKKSDEYSVFEISTALSCGQGDKAIKLMKKMLETMEFPVILGLISAHFRRMLYANLAEGTNGEIANLLGVKEFAVAKAKTLAKHIKPSAILQINNLILQIDYDIKSGKMNAENAMYFLVLQICHLVKGEK
ncbi:MAG: DNA polymerase III subunit delta [Clostridia bacterium]